MKKVTIALFTLFTLSGCCGCKPGKITCEHDGKVVLQVQGYLNSHRGTTDIRTDDGRYIVPAQTWTCTKR